MNKVEELKEKLQEVVETLKKKISKLGKKKGDDDDDFEDEDLDEDTGEVEVRPDELKEDDEATKTDVDQDEEDDDEDEEDEEDDAQKKKKQKKLLTQGVLILLIVFLAYDILMNDESSNEVPPAPANAVKKRKPRKRRVRNKPEPKKEIAKEREPTPTPTPTSTPTPIKEVTPAPPPKVEATISPEPTIEVTATPTPTPGPPESSQEEASGIPPETPSSPLDERIGEGKEEEKSLTMDDKVDSILEKSKEEQAKEDEKPLDSDKNISEETPSDYVEPPNYKRLGRGLVYNCIGRHWACVDKLSYFQCRENNKWNQAKGKSSECVTKNVYASEEDCGVIQLHYINTREATDFCDSQEESKPKTKTEIMVQ